MKENKFKIIIMSNKNNLTAEELFVKAIAAKTYKTKLEICDKILKKDSKFGPALLLKMNIWSDDGKYKEIIKLCDKILKKSPKEVVFLYQN